MKKQNLFFSFLIFLKIKKNSNFNLISVFFQGADCCGLVFGCSNTRGGNGCPFPVCGTGFALDQSTNQCVKHLATTQTTLSHTPYSSFNECRQDFARNGADHCFAPLERAYRICKHNAGLN